MNHEVPQWCLMVEPRLAGKDGLQLGVVPSAWKTRESFMAVFVPVRGVY